MAADWFDAQGKPVPTERVEKVINLLAMATDEPMGNIRVAVEHAAHFVERDDPERALRTMRFLLGTNEGLVLRAFAVMLADDEPVLIRQSADPTSSDEGGARSDG